MKDSKLRFSDRAQDYSRFRPTYPAEVLQTLKYEFGLKPDHVIADIGSGTGISSEMFLRNGNMVFAVEPNLEMRKQAEHLLGQFESFKSVNGSAESTTLIEHSIDFIICAQAFHWFDPIKTRIEFERIIKPEGKFLILFNDRKMNGSAFNEDYEKLMCKISSEYEAIKAVNRIEKRHLNFLGTYAEFHFPSYQEFDLKSLLGRIASSSYSPKPGDPRFEYMTSEVEALFEKCQSNGKVRLEYDTQLFSSTAATAVTA